MIIALALAFPAIVLIGLATPRQAGWLFRVPPARPWILRWRSTGWLLLIVSLGPVLAGDDRVRQLVGWIGAIGMIALDVALAFSVLTRRSS